MFIHESFQSVFVKQNGDILMRCLSHDVAKLYNIWWKSLTKHLVNFSGCCDLLNFQSRTRMDTVFVSLRQHHISAAADITNDHNFESPLWLDCKLCFCSLLIVCQKHEPCQTVLLQVWVPFWVVLKYKTYCPCAPMEYTRLHHNPHVGYYTIAHKFWTTISHFKFSHFPSNQT